MHAQIPENHWQCECSKSDDPGTNAGTHYPCIFRNLCVNGAIVIVQATLVVLTEEGEGEFSGVMILLRRGRSAAKCSSATHYSYHCLSENRHVLFCVTILTRVTTHVNVFK